MHVTSLRVEEAVMRLKGSFLEMPGTQLTVCDAARLTGLEDETCSIILSALEDARFLRRRTNGVFVRRTSESPES